MIDYNNSYDYETLKANQQLAFTVLVKREYVLKLTPEGLDTLVELAKLDGMTFGDKLAQALEDATNGLFEYRDIVHSESTIFEN